jgi:hypothetical protein
MAFFKKQYNIYISENRFDPTTSTEVNAAIRDIKHIITVPEDSPDYVSTIHKY